MLPVNYKLHDGSIMFRTAQDSPTDEDLRTGIAHAEYEVAFEIDDIDPVTQGRLECAHPRPGAPHGLRSRAGRGTGVGRRAMAGRAREHAIRITPSRDHRPPHLTPSDPSTA